MYDTTKPYIGEILRLIRETWETPFVSVRDGLLHKKFSYPDCQPEVDGIGTKGIFHWQKRSFEFAVEDALAMGLNDIILRRAVTYGILPHVFLPEDDHPAFLEIAACFVRECRKRDIAILNGESAVHNNMRGMEISLTVLGFVPAYKENRFRMGDILIGIWSNGLHSNGFSKVRELFGEEWREEFTAPTAIYSELLLDLNLSYDIHGLAHITGGAFTKLKRILPSDADALIIQNHKLDPHLIFHEIFLRGVRDEEMYVTFNCGVGFVISTNLNEASACVSRIQAQGYKADIIGRIVRGKGRVLIGSKFSGKEVEF